MPDYEQAVRDHFRLRLENPLTYLKVFDTLKALEGLWEYYLSPLEGEGSTLNLLAGTFPKEDVEPWNKVEDWVNKTASLIDALLDDHEKDVRENFSLEAYDAMAYVKMFQMLRRRGRLWEYYIQPVERTLSELATAVARDDAELEKRVDDTADLIEALVAKDPKTVGDHFRLPPTHASTYVKIYSKLRARNGLWQYYLLPVEGEDGTLSRFVKSFPQPRVEESWVRDTAPVIDALLKTNEARKGRLGSGYVGALNYLAANGSVSKPLADSASRRLKRLCESGQMFRHLRRAKGSDAVAACLLPLIEFTFSGSSFDNIPPKDLRRDDELRAGRTYYGQLERTGWSRRRGYLNGVVDLILSLDRTAAFLDTLQAGKKLDAYIVVPRKSAPLPVGVLQEIAQLDEEAQHITSPLMLKHYELLRRVITPERWAAVVGRLVSKGSLVEDLNGRDKFLQRFTGLYADAFPFLGSSGGARARFIDVVTNGLRNLTREQWAETLQDESSDLLELLEAVIKVTLVDLGSKLGQPLLAQMARVRRRRNPHRRQIQLRRLLELEEALTERARKDVIKRLNDEERDLGDYLRKILTAAERQEFLEG